MITIKTEAQLKKIRRACRIVAKVLENLSKAVKPGVTTEEIDRLGEEMLSKLGAKPAFLGYRGYKHSACLSVNEEVVHGIPGSRKLKEGDIIGVDVGSLVDGYYGDIAATLPVGRVSNESRDLIDATRECLMLGISKARNGATIGDIGEAIETHALEAGFSVVRDLFGHGVGTNLHEDPLVPNFGKAGEGVKLRAGMVIAIEPMLNVGGHGIKTLADGWTVVTADGKLSAHFEHTIVITEGEPEILTLA
jgi:methionyl aminopeptidase